MVQVTSPGCARGAEPRGRVREPHTAGSIRRREPCPVPAVQRDGLASGIVQGVLHCGARWREGVEVYTTPSDRGVVEVDRVRHHHTAAGAWEAHTGSGVEEAKRFAVWDNEAGYLRFLLWLRPVGRAPRERMSNTLLHRACIHGSASCVLVILRHLQSFYYMPQVHHRDGGAGGQHGLYCDAGCVAALAAWLVDHTQQLHLAVPYAYASGRLGAELTRFAGIPPDGNDLG